jgi:hypothetical protein
MIRTTMTEGIRERDADEEIRNEVEVPCRRLQNVRIIRDIIICILREILE